MLLAEKSMLFKPTKLIMEDKFMDLYAELEFKKNQLANEEKKIEDLKTNFRRWDAQSLEMQSNYTDLKNSIRDILSYDIPNLQPKLIEEFRQAYKDRNETEAKRRHFRDLLNEMEKRIMAQREEIDNLKNRIIDSLLLE